VINGVSKFGDSIGRWVFATGAIGGFMILLMVEGWVVLKVRGNGEM
jgi:hypothetical protein